jgi:hypothetical protein
LEEVEQQRRQQEVREVIQREGHSSRSIVTRRSRKNAPAQFTSTCSRSCSARMVGQFQIEACEEWSARRSSTSSFAVPRGCPAPRPHPLGIAVDQNDARALPCGRERCGLPMSEMAPVTRHTRPRIESVTARPLMPNVPVLSAPHGAAPGRTGDAGVSRSRTGGSTSARCKAQEPTIDQAARGGRTLAHRGQPFSAVRPSEATRWGPPLAASATMAGSMSLKRSFAARRTARDPSSATVTQRRPRCRSPRSRE